MQSNGEVLKDVMVEREELAEEAMKAGRGVFF